MCKSIIYRNNKVTRPQLTSGGRLLATSLKPFGVSGQKGKAGWLELGTSRMPPRPVFKAAFFKIAPELEKMARREATRAFGGSGEGAHLVREMFHIMKRAIEDVRDVAEGALDEP